MQPPQAPPHPSTKPKRPTAHHHIRTKKTREKKKKETSKGDTRLCCFGLSPHFRGVSHIRTYPRHCCAQAGQGPTKSKIRVFLEISRPENKTQPKIRAFSWNFLKKRNSKDVLHRKIGWSSLQFSRPDKDVPKP